MVTPKRRPIPLTPRTLPSAERKGGGGKKERKKSSHFLWLWLSSFCNLYLRILCPLCVAVIYSSTISLLYLLLLLLPPAVAAVATAAASIPHRDSLTFLIIHPSFSRSPKLTEPPKAIRSDCLISRHQVGRAEMKNEDSSQPLFLFCFHSPFHSSLSLSLSPVFFSLSPFPTSPARFYSIRPHLGPLLAISLLLPHPLLYRWLPISPCSSSCFRSLRSSAGFDWQLRWRGRSHGEGSDCAMSF